MSALGGKYRVGERIGGGGMADVFRAELLGAEGFARSVAVKRMKRSISGDKEFAKLFIAEARLAAKLSHANVVQTLDFSRDEEGCFYLVMELIDGVDLRQLVQSGRVPISACVFVVSEVIRALDYAHEMFDDGQSLTIVHRDISPHNIMLSWQGSVKVVDFGIAKAIAGSLVSRSGSLKGKVAYMSPEQVHGHALDGRSDLFALGIIMHELLSGERLFVGESEAATLSKLLTQPIAVPSSLNDQVPTDIDRIVMKLLARDREQRYLRARDVLDDLLASSVSVVRGRADLETVLAERFPDRAPRRVPRLSTSGQDPASSSQGLVPDTLPSVSAHAPGRPAETGSDDCASAQTMPASPKVLPAISVAAMPKRTLTAPSVRTDLPKSAPQDAAGDLETIASRSRMRLHAVLVVLAALLGATLLWFGGVFDKKKTSNGALRLVVPMADPQGPMAERLDAGTKPGAENPQVVPDAAEALARVSDADAGASRAGEVDHRRLKKARLTLSVRPWATILVDGKSYGQTPQTIELTQGKHRVIVENEGLDRKESFTITLKPGQLKTVDKDWR